ACPPARSVVPQFSGKNHFYNACAFAAQLDHFMGRDMTSVAFSWPTRQNIAAYVIGNDVARGSRSAPALASLIRAIADNSEARRIHIVTWSAGGRVVTEALTQLCDLFPEDTPEQLRERFRLGRVYYAAADVPRETFLAALPKINSLVQEVIVTASSKDEALQSAALFMGGSTRIGQIGKEPLTPEQIEVVLAADRLQAVDVSGGREERGFDITGHRYWLDHPWASTDMLLTIRTDLEPAERGLIPGKFQPVHWIMPTDYEERIRAFIESKPTSVRESE
ncbi:MAG: alpha/beta hydrolase, partial [Oceanipulchritudo sp.]